MKIAVQCIHLSPICCVDLLLFTIHSKSNTTVSHCGLETVQRLSATFLLKGDNCDELLSRES